jgi:hypothetical protein
VSTRALAFSFNSTSLSSTLIRQHARVLCVAVRAPLPQASARHHALSPPQSGPGTPVLRPCLEPDSLSIAACDVLSLFLASVRPSLAPSYATFAANVSVAQCYECMSCGHMGLRRLTFLSSERRLRFKNLAPPPVLDWPYLTVSFSPHFTMYVRLLSYAAPC